MTNQYILQTALQQSAYDMNCDPKDFLSDKNVVNISQKNARARKYLELPLLCDLASYGGTVVAQASEELAPLVQSKESTALISPMVPMEIRSSWFLLVI